MKLKKIVSACPAGLGNRIKCMVSTMKRCGEEDAIAFPYVYWPVNKECGCEFKDLFDESTIPEQIWESELQTIQVDARYNDAYINKSWKLQTDKISGIDFQYHKLSQSQKDEFLHEIQFIHPKEDIKDAAWAFMNKHKESFDKGEVVGVHIRKGDFNISFDGRQNISKEDDFASKIYDLLEINPNYKFLLCTEDAETEDTFKKVFGDDTIIHFPKRFRGRNNSNGIKEAFVDMLLLSKCPIILGTFLSTFTEIAWWLGGCEAQVYIPGTYDKEAVAKVMAKLPKEGEGIHKKVWRKIKILGERGGIYGR